MVLVIFLSVLSISDFSLLHFPLSFVAFSACKFLAATKEIEVVKRDRVYGFEMFLKNLQRPHQMKILFFKKDFIQGNPKFTSKISLDVPPAFNNLKFLESAKAMILKNVLLLT